MMALFHRNIHRKRKEGKSHHVAIRSLANNWVRIIYALWKKQEQYDPAIFRALS